MRHVLFALLALVAACDKSPRVGSAEKPVATPGFAAASGATTAPGAVGTPGAMGTPGTMAAAGAPAAGAGAVAFIQPQTVGTMGTGTTAALAPQGGAPAGSGPTTLTPAQLAGLSADERAMYQQLSPEEKALIAREIAANGMPPGDQGMEADGDPTDMEPGYDGTGAQAPSGPAGQMNGGSAPTPRGEPAAPAPGTAGSNEPPAIVRMILPAKIRESAPFGRGDYLVALDYRDEGFGTYGYLYTGDGRWFVIEQDKVVGGPIADGGTEMTQVTARWREGETARHNAVMRGVASLPHGCLSGCVFTDGRGSYQIEY